MELLRAVRQRVSGDIDHRYRLEHVRAKHQGRQVRHHRNFAHADDLPYTRQDRLVSRDHAAPGAGWLTATLRIVSTGMVILVVK
jgi:hypothetical protein